MRLLAIIWLTALPLSLARAEDKPKNDSPRIVAVSPLEIVPGQPVTLRVRGLKLDTATGFQLTPASPGIQAILGEKKKAAVPNGAEAKKVGDTEVEVKLSVAADIPREPLHLLMETPEGRTTAVEIRVLDPGQVLQEKEPNGGFSEAQPILRGKIVCGAIGGDKDVDVFRFEGRRGMKVALEVQAARLSSLLDPVLSLHTTGGQLLGTADDTKGRDPRLEATLPADGAYCLAITDAQDTGGAWHVYELTVDEIP